VEASGVHATMIFNECGVFALDVTAHSQVAGLPHRRPLHSRQPIQPDTNIEGTKFAKCCADHRAERARPGSMLPPSSAPRTRSQFGLCIVMGLITVHIRPIPQPLYVLRGTRAVPGWPPAHGMPDLQRSKKMNATGVRPKAKAM